MNDYLALIEDLNSINLSDPGGVLECSDDKINEIFKKNALDLYTSVFLLSKIHVNRFYNTGLPVDDPYTHYFSTGLYKKTLENFTDEFESVFDFFEKLFLLDLIRLPLSDPTVKSFISTHKNDLDLCTDAEFKIHFLENQKLQTEILLSQDRLHENNHLIKPLRFDWYRKNRNAVFDYYKILIQRREAYINNIQEHSINSAQDSQLQHLHSCLNRVISDYKFLDIEIPEYINAGTILSFLDHAGISILKDKNFEENLRKAKKLKAELVKDSHPDSLRFREVSAAEQRIKKQLYQSIMTLNPESSSYLQDMEDLWIQYTVALHKFSPATDMDVHKKIELLKKSNKSLKRELVRLIEEINKTNDHISMLRVEILNSDLIKKTVKSEKLKGSRKSISKTNKENL